MECSKGHALVLNYYPPCPQPHLTLGTSKHLDPDFLTILLQYHIGGLQVLYQNHWIDLPPLKGALVVNIGDLLQVSSLNICFQFLDDKYLNSIWTNCMCSWSQITNLEVMIIEFLQTWLVIEFLLLASLLCIFTRWHESMVLSRNYYLINGLLYIEKYICENIFHIISQKDLTDSQLLTI